MGYIFLCGSDMDPVAIRQRDGGTGMRFESIGSVAAAEMPELPGLDDRVWGIVVRDDAASEGQGIEVTLRDGRTVTANLATRPADVADRKAVIAQARYWELPVQWWQKLSES